MLILLYQGVPGLLFGLVLRGSRPAWLQPLTATRICCREQLLHSHFTFAAHVGSRWRQFTIPLCAFSTESWARQFTIPCCAFSITESWASCMNIYLWSYVFIVYNIPHVLVFFDWIYVAISLTLFFFPHFQFIHFCFNVGLLAEVDSAVFPCHGECFLKLPIMTAIYFRQLNSFNSHQR